MCACVLIALGGTGCGGAGPAMPATAKAPARKSGSAALKPQRALLSLPIGRSSVHFRIKAPSPARYIFDIALDLPAAAHIVVQFRTWYGAVLDILDYRPGEQSESSTVMRSTGCEANGSRLKCMQHYPLLEAQKAGPWTIVVLKRSRPAANVGVTVTFREP
jgi:hypothetical protein